MRRTALGLLAALGLLIPLGGCTGSEPGPAGGGEEAGAAEVPSPDLAGVERRVRLAVVTARQAVREDPESAAAWGALGQVLDAHELDPEAEAAYARAAELDADDPRWPYLLGRLVSFRGTEPEEALRLLGEAVDLEPGYAPGHLRLADELARQDRPADAEAAYRAALERDASLAKAHLGLGRVLLIRDRVEDAVAALGRAVELDPADGAAWGELSRARLRAGDADGARVAAERSRETTPVDGYPDPRLQEVSDRAVSSGVVFDRALLLLDAGDPAGAARELTSVAAEKDADPYFHRALGRAYLEMGRAGEARPRLERAVELSPELVDARIWLAAVLIETGDPAAARRQLDEARRRLDAAEGTGAADRRDLERLLYGHRGRAFIAEERMEEGIDSLRQAAGRGKLEPVFESAWGQALAQQGRFAEAVPHFERAVEGNPRSAQARFQLGLAYEGLGRTGPAVEQYRKSMEIEPNPMAAGRLRALGAM